MLSRRALLASALAAPAAVAALRPALAQPAAQPPAPAAGTWSPCAAIPWKVQEVYGTVRAGKAIIAGGMETGGFGLRALDRTGIYDPTTDSWQEGPRLPERRHHPVLATVGARVYAIGGAVDGPAGNWQQRPDVFVEEGGQWTRTTPLPVPQMESVALVHDGRIHLISGRSPAKENDAHWRDQKDVDTHRVFDPASGKWETLRPIPGARNSAAGGVIDGALYIVGGRTMAEGNMARLDRYDPKSDRWEALRPLPYPAGGLGAVVLRGSLITFGGEELGVPGTAGVIAHVWRYDVARDAWEPLAPMRTPRHGLAGVAIGNRLYAIGGGSETSTGNTTAIVEAFQMR